MATPSSFNLQKKSAEGRPPPAPPARLKHQICSKSDFFKIVDDHAINVAMTGYTSFRDLIWNLIYKKDLNELEKARVIFRWMTMKNKHSFNFDSETTPGTPEALLRGFKYGGTAFARTFECLALHAGLHCTILAGWVKTSKFLPGTSLTSQTANHSWNAVYIDGSWQLVDCHWATNSQSSEPGGFYKFDDFFFIPDPTDFIYSHYPEDPAWQLCNPIRSQAEYENGPLVRSNFYNLGMKFLQQNQGIIHTHNGILALTLGLTKPANFIFKLTYGDNGPENFQDVSLKRYVAMETTDNRLTFYIRAPQKGNYYLTVFGQPVPENLILDKSCNDVCKFKIICDQVPLNVKPFPECTDSSYGPGVSVRQCGLTACHKEGILPAPEGKAKVVFKKSRPVEFLLRLRHVDKTEQQLQNAVSVKDQDNEVSILCDLPNRGEYGLAIYAKDSANKGATNYTHICQYLLTYTDQDFQSVYGKVYDRHDLSSLVPYNYAQDEYASVCANPSKGRSNVAGAQSQETSVVNSMAHLRATGEQAKHRSPASTTPSNNRSATEPVTPFGAISSSAQNPTTVSKVVNPVLQSQRKNPPSDVHHLISQPSSNNRSEAAAEPVTPFGAMSSSTQSPITMNKVVNPVLQSQRINPPSDVHHLVSQTSSSQQDKPASSPQASQSAGASQWQTPGSVASRGNIISKLNNMIESKINADKPPPPNPPPGSRGRPSNKASGPSVPDSYPPCTQGQQPLAIFICPLCFEDDKQIRASGKKLMATKCRHVFCDTCINDFFHAQQRCPSCKTWLSSSDIQPVDNSLAQFKSAHSK